MSKTKRPFLKQLCSLLLAVVLCTSLLVCPAQAAGQDIDSAELNRLNVMLVIDGSGSLIASNGGTDPNGLRYDAIELFLALLTNSGNNVGAIVFDDSPEGFLLNAAPTPIEGKTDKMALAQQIRDAGTRANTDIGTALLSAVDTLVAQNQQNQKNSAVILFSDGRTDLNGDEEAYQASLENKESAIETAQSNHIPVYSICLAATDVADPAELQEISSRTSGGFVAVDTAQDLSQAFEEFYSLIFDSSCENTVTDQFSPDGTLSYSFDVPSFGAEEVNIILDRSQVKDVALTAPSGAMSASALEDSAMNGGNYQVIKLTDPEKGHWDLTLKGNSGSDVTINVLYNVDSSAVLSTADGATDYTAGSEISFQLSLYQNGQPVTDTSVTSDYQPEVTIVDLATGEEQSLPMQAAADGSFTGSFNGKDYTSYEVKASLTSGDIVLPAQSMRINIGNSAPVPVDTPEISKTVVVTPITGHKQSFDLSELFQDAQDEDLQYDVVSSQLVDGSVSLEGSNLSVQTSKSRSGDLVVQATDSQGAFCDIVFHFKVINLSPAIFTILVVGALIFLALLLTAMYMGRPAFKDLLYVADVNSDPMQTAMSHAAFRGKLKLKYFMVPGCGLDPEKCYFVPARGGRLEFHAPKNVQVYVNDMPQNTVNLFMGCTTEIYADKEMTRGIRVTVSSTSMM